MSRCRLHAAALVVAALALAPARTEASGFPVGGAGALERLLTWGEILWPDLRFELRDDAFENNLVLSWPIHKLIWQGYGEGFQTQRDISTLTLFGEPQWVPWRDIGRGLVGVRYAHTFVRGPDYDAIGFLVEAAGVWGHDGYGGVGGLGVFAPGFTAIPIALVYRHVYGSDGHRDDLSLDVTFPIE